MLNPPLSNLSDDLISYITYHISRLPHGDEYLHNLSLADRAFTHFCQERLFRTLKLAGETRTKFSSKLEKILSTWGKKPAFPTKVCKIRLSFSQLGVSWVLGNQNFNRIFDALASSPMPPYELYLRSLVLPEKEIRLVQEWFSQSFFRKSLTVLHLTSCRVPLTLLRDCLRLREVALTDIETAEEVIDNTSLKDDPDNNLPCLIYLDFRHAHTFIDSLVFPPSSLHKGVISWSALRVLTMAPHVEEEMRYLQPILNFSRDTLEELYLDKVKRTAERRHVFLANLVNLSDLPRLRVFGLFVVINCNDDKVVVLQDVSLVLNTIPSQNVMENISFDFFTVGTYPFNQVLFRNWEGLCNEVARVSSGRHIEVELYMTVVRKGQSFWDDFPKGVDLILEALKERMTWKLQDYPSVCAHFWDQAYWTRAFGPYTGGKVRPRCKR